MALGQAVRDCSVGPKGTFIVNIILKILKQNNKCINTFALVSSLYIPNLYVTVSSLLLKKDTLSELKVLQVMAPTCSPTQEKCQDLCASPGYIVSYRPSDTTL